MGPRVLREEAPQGSPAAHLAHVDMRRPLVAEREPQHFPRKQALQQLPGGTVAAGVAWCSDHGAVCATARSHPLAPQRVRGLLRHGDCDDRGAARRRIERFDATLYRCAKRRVEQRRQAHQPQELGYDRPGQGAGRVGLVPVPVQELVRGAEYRVGSAPVQQEVRPEAEHTAEQLRRGHAR